MSRIKECTISAYECLWTGRNKIEIERFFKLAKYEKFNFVEDDGELLLYDEFMLIEKGYTIIANQTLGIISRFKDA